MGRAVLLDHTVPTHSNLPERLRTATRELHQAAERSGVMRALLAGRLPRTAYVQLLINLRAVYGSLEPALSRHAQDAALKGVSALGLWRLQALDADLAGGGQQALAPSTLVYVARLNTLSESHPVQLLAHVYTRWLGDLHGGQILGALIRRQFPGQGTAFYDFSAVGPVTQLQQRLRQALSPAHLNEADSAAVVREACWSFQQHATMFEELALESAAPPGA
jgi:heme oxygenase